jgi:hypothetical protein
MRLVDFMLFPEWRQAQRLYQLRIMSRGAFYELVLHSE